MLACSIVSGVKRIVFQWKQLIAAKWWGPVGSRSMLTDNTCITAACQRGGSLYCLEAEAELIAAKRAFSYAAFSLGLLPLFSRRSGVNYKQKQ